MATPRPDQWRDRTHFKHWATIYPNQLDRLADMRADVLITHEAPGYHPNGFGILDTLAQSMGVKVVVHGHHHDRLDSSARWAQQGFRSYGVGLRGITAIDADGRHVASSTDAWQSWPIAPGCKPGPSWARWFESISIHQGKRDGSCGVVVSQLGCGGESGLSRLVLSQDAERQIAGSNPAALASLLDVCVATRVASFHGCLAERSIAPGCKPGPPSGARWFKSISIHHARATRDAAARRTPPNSVVAAEIRRSQAAASDAVSTIAGATRQGARARDAGSDKWPSGRTQPDDCREQRGAKQHGALAQLEERWIVYPRVRSSNLLRIANATAGGRPVVGLGFISPRKAWLDTRARNRTRRDSSDGRAAR